MLQTKQMMLSGCIDVPNRAGSIRDINLTGGNQNCVVGAIATDATLSARRASALPRGPTSISVLEKNLWREI